MCKFDLFSRAAAEKAIAASGFAGKIARVRCPDARARAKFDPQIADLRCGQDADDAGRRGNDSQNLALKVCDTQRGGDMFDIRVMGGTAGGARG